MPVTPQTTLRLSPNALAHLVDSQLPLPLAKEQLILLIAQLKPTLANIPTPATTSAGMNREGTKARGEGGGRNTVLFTAFRLHTVHNTVY